MMPPVRDDDGYYDDGRGRRRPRKSNTSTILLAIAAVLVLVGAIFVGKALFGNGGASGQVEVPELGGQSYSQAKTLGDNGGFKVRMGSPTFCDQPKGKVCDTTPKKGNKIDRGHAVALNMSKGPAPVDVPDVVGSSATDAKQKLSNAGFQVKEQPEESEEEEGQILRQDPAGGQKAQKNSVINLTVATTSKTMVPSVVGKSYDEAKAQLEDVGFTVAKAEEDDESKPADTVIKQSPEANNEHPDGEQVTLTVAKAPDDQPAKVPDVTDQLVADARKALEDAGFGVKVAGEPDEENSTVVTTTPPANSEGKEGDEITIVARPGKPGDEGGDDGGIFGGAIGG